VRTADWKYTRYFANDRSPFGQEGRQGEGGAVSDALVARYAHWLIASINGEKPVYEELFHLRNDPEETTNLAHDSRHAAVLRDLRARCQQLVTEAKGDVSAPPATLRVQGSREARGHNTKQP
jgi:arylsulfatase A-like enzyme